MNEFNKNVVKDVYAAFQRGNIPALLICLTEDVHWFSIGPPMLIPTAGTRYGRDQVEEYFATFESIEEVESFTPLEFIAEGEKVVAIGEMRSRIKRTNTLIKTPWGLTFRNGKISDFRSFCDTAAVVLAFSEKQTYPAKAATTASRSAGIF